MNVSKLFRIKEQSTMQSWFGGRIPIVLGTVGHRDLDQPANSIAKSVRRECKSLRRKYPHSPFLVLSGLAEGADRIVADVAIKELSAKLIAILPFPEQEFRADFTTRRSQDEFSSLLNTASAIIEMSPPPDSHWQQNGKLRDVQYARVGALIAEQSQILIALWDNQPARGIGGTAEVVGWFKRGYAPPEYSIYKGDLSLFDPPQPGLCIRIDPATLKRDPAIAGPKRKRSTLSERNDIREILRRTEAYNRDVYRDPASFRNIEKTPLVPEDIFQQAPISEAFSAFQEADALSIHYSRRVRLGDWVLYALALTAVFAFSLIDVKPLASWSFLGVMGMMAFVAFYAGNRSLDTKFLEYRSFAEAMRILFFWRLVGLKRQVWLSYLSKHGNVVRWLRHAVRAVEFAQDQRLMETQMSGSGKNLSAAVIRHWVQVQIDYFKLSEIRHCRRYVFGLWVTRIAIALTFATSALLAIMTLQYGKGWHAWNDDEIITFSFGSASVETFIQQLQVAVSLTAAFGIAARGFLIRSADLELAKQYASTREKFELAERKINELQEGYPEEELLGIFEQLGREALLEQAEWLWLRHSRPFEPPS